MNTTPSHQSLTAQSIKGLRWIEQGKVGAYVNERGFGVINEAGQWLSFDGATPSVWDRKAIAVEIATTLTEGAGYSWITAVPA